MQLKYDLSLSEFALDLLSVLELSKDLQLNEETWNYTGSQQKGYICWDYQPLYDSQVSHIFH